MSDMFKGIEKKTGVKMEDVMKIAQSLNGANLKDEKTVRKLVGQVSRLAGKKVSKETEDKIVKSLINGNQKIDAATISKMMNKKK